MNFPDIKLLQKDQKNLSVPFPIKKRRESKGYVSINDIIPIPVENVASFYNRSVDLPIKKDDGTEIGYLHFTKGIEIDNLFSLSESKYACFLIDIPDKSIIYGSLKHLFQSDYVVIYLPHLEFYISRCLSSAPIWGHFNHKYSSVAFHPALKKPLTEIVVAEYSRFNHEYYFESTVRGIKHSLAFERYLKYYHLLELNFDFDVIERIKTLDTVTDSKSISMLLNEYKREDIERLKYLFYTYCVDLNPIIDLLNGVNAFQNIAKEIFYDFGKESNPLKDFGQFTDILGRPGGFSLANCRLSGVQSVNNADSHRKFICNLSSYWVYRVRNSIAHKKIGEYIMSHNDESFILSFAEPLLLGLLKQIFK